MAAAHNLTPSRPGRRLSSEELAHLSAKGSCFHCHQQGHIARNCPVRSLPGRGRGQRRYVPKEPRSVSFAAQAVGDDDNPSSDDFGEYNTKADPSFDHDGTSSDDTSSPASPQKGVQPTNRTKTLSDQDLLAQLANLQTIIQSRSSARSQHLKD